MTDAPRAVPRLMPCPFCGGHARIKKANSTFGLIVCDGTPCVGSGLFKGIVVSKIDTAIAAWNRRAARAHAEALIAPTKR